MPYFVFKFQENQFYDDGRYKRTAVVQFARKQSLNVRVQWLPKAGRWNTD